MKRKVERFVKWELEMFRAECNFTPDEAMFFDLRNGDESMTLEEIAGEMGYSTSKITDLVNSVNDKIKRFFHLEKRISKNIVRNTDKIWTKIE